MANTYNSKNYFAHGGEQLVIGGKLTFLDGAEVENFPGSTSGTAASGTAPYVADSGRGGREFSRQHERNRRFRHRSLCG